MSFGILRVDHFSHGESMRWFNRPYSIYTSCLFPLVVLCYPSYCQQPCSFRCASAASVICGLFSFSPPVWLDRCAFGCGKRVSLACAREARSKSRSDVHQALSCLPSDLYLYRAISSDGRSAYLSHYSEPWRIPVILLTESLRSGHLLTVSTFNESFL